MWMSEARECTALTMMRSDSLMIGASSMSIDLSTLRSIERSTLLSIELDMSCWSGPRLAAPPDPPPLMKPSIDRLEAMPPCSKSPMRNRSISSPSRSIGSWITSRSRPGPTIGSTSVFLKVASSFAMSILAMSSGFWRSM